MPTSNKEFSEGFRKRIYRWILNLISSLEKLPKNDDVSYVIRRQLLRSATSIGANYTEAIAGTSRKDFANFASHSLKSSNESKFWIALLRDTNRGKAEEVELLFRELSEISNILGSIVRTLRTKEPK